MVTNCTNEWPGSLVTETLKDEILIPKDTSKESDFYADFKYISFYKFSLAHQNLQAWENCLIFEKMGKHPLKVIESWWKSDHQIQCIKNLVVEVSSSYLRKCGILWFLPEERSRMCVYLFLLFCFFPIGVIVSTQWYNYVARGFILTEIKSSSAIFKWKNWRATWLPPTLIFFQITGSKF